MIAAAPSARASNARVSGLTVGIAVPAGGGILVGTGVGVDPTGVTVGVGFGVGVVPTGVTVGVGVGVGVVPAGVTVGVGVGVGVVPTGVTVGVGVGVGVVPTGVTVGVGVGVGAPPVVICPIRPLPSANQRLPSGPAVMPSRIAPALMPAQNSVTTPAVVIRPIRLPACSVNHRLPSGPAVMPNSVAPGLMPVLNSVTTPAVVISPDPVAALFGEPQVAVRAGRDGERGRAGGQAAELGHDSRRRDSPDLVAAVFREPEVPVGTGNDAGRVRAGGDAGQNSVTTPTGVIRPIRLPRSSVNHRLPSGPAVMKKGSENAVMPVPNSVTTPAGVIFATRLMSKLRLRSVNHRLPSDRPQCRRAARRP